MFALTWALQWELDVGTLSSSFGPATLSALTAKYPLLNAATVPNAVLRRYQGWGDDPDLTLAVARRMVLFYMFERYNTIARNA